MTKWGLVALVGAVVCAMPTAALAARQEVGPPHCQAGRMTAHVRSHLLRDHRRVPVRRWRCVGAKPNTTHTTPTPTDARTSATGNSTCGLDTTGCYNLISATVYYPFALLPVALGTP